MSVLAGDIGGTHARLALFPLDDGGPAREPILERVRPSRAYDGPVPLVRAFLREAETRYGADGRPAAACLALAGPIVGGVCRLPNLGWEVRVADLPAELGIDRTAVVNDFDALAQALPLLGPADLAELQAGEPEEGGPVALLGPGTGLGQAFLTWEGGRYRVHSSEGGHADFAPRDPLECRLLLHLSDRYGRASWERVLSGPGLVDLYGFLREDGHAEERPETRRRLASEDPARTISELGMAGEDPLCAAALERFVSLLGSLAGNLALTVQATGGVYVGGGIAPDILPALREGAFRRAFRDKGRMADLLESVAVRVVTEPRAALFGAAFLAAELT